MSRPERRRIHLWLIGLVAGLVTGYVVIAGPVVYIAARGWLPDVVYQTFCIPLFALFGTPAWGGVGGYSGAIVPHLSPSVPAGMPEVP